MDRVPQVLNYWFASADEVAVRPISTGRGFSGAQHWLVEQPGRQLALRQWRPGSVHAERLAQIHALQQHLADSGLPTPSPLPARDGATFVMFDRTLWELAPWMPGVADYWHDPRPAKLHAALATLAELHIAAARFPKPLKRLDVSPALQNRWMRLGELKFGGMTALYQTVERIPGESEKNQAQETVALVAQLAAMEWDKSRPWRGRQFPLQWCLRDIWHDHVLFTGDRVSGVIDYGAVAIDTVAGDIARLLGSMVGDDRDGSRLGIEAYESVRPLSGREREVIPFFDSSGVLLSAVNWLRWLYADRSALAPSVDRSMALERLGSLVRRLRHLAAASRL